MFLKALNFPKEMCCGAMKFSLAASGCGTALVHVVPLDSQYISQGTLQR